MPGKGEPYREFVMYAWIGEDELGSGIIGLKQGLMPAGMIPLAAMDHHLDRLTNIKPSLERQAAASGKKVRLYRFVSQEVVDETEEGDWRGQRRKAS
jgi:hypothetical protein